VYESCAAFGRNLKEFVAPEANIYNVLCYESDVSGCSCDYDLSLIGGPSGRWAADGASATLTFFDAPWAVRPRSPAIAKRVTRLELTGKDAHACSTNSVCVRSSSPAPRATTAASKSTGELGVDWRRLMQSGAARRHGAARLP